MFDSFRSFCEAEGLPAEAFADLLRSSPEVRRELRRVEIGAVGEERFAEVVGGLLGIDGTAGLVDRLFAGLRPDPEMLDAVRRARADGIRTGMVSNSIGEGRYDRSAFPELFDAVVISGEEGVHKPQPEIYRLGAERIGVAPEECVFVDDVSENCEGAEAVGITAVLHRGVDGTLPRLEELLGVTLGALGQSRDEIRGYSPRK